MILFGFLWAFSATIHAEGDLLKNGGFEIQDSQSLPSDWMTEAYQTGAQYRITAAKAYQGKFALQISCPTDNDARMVQTVAVKPNTYYRFSGYISTENVSKPAANLCIMVDFNHSQPLMQGTSDWTYQEVNFHTHSNQTEVKLAVRLGMWGNTASGKALFDGLSLVELSSAPANVYELKDPNVTTQTNVGGNKSKLPLWLVPLALIVVIIILGYEIKTHRKS